MIGDVIANAFNVDGIKQWPYVLNGIIKEDKVDFVFQGFRKQQIQIRER